jgi:hypothetical protein
MKNSKFKKELHKLCNIYKHGWTFKDSNNIEIIPIIDDWVYYESVFDYQIGFVCMEGFNCKCSPEEVMFRFFHKPRQKGYLKNKAKFIEKLKETYLYIKLKDL